MNIQKKLANYYNRFAKLYGNSLKTVNWSSRKNQELRFKQFLSFLPQTSFTINDIGCGVGDFSTYLQKNITTEFKYFGYDISSEMIGIANENFNTIYNVQFTAIDNLQQVVPADYSIASGTFNKRFLFPSKRRYVDFFYESISYMHTKSKIGFGVNFLSDNHKSRFYDGLLYLNEKEVLNYGKKNFGNHFVVLDNYHKIDRTIWWYKNQKVV